MTLLIKLLIIAGLIAILVSLGMGMVFMLKDSGKSRRTVNALTVRIALSVTLFLLLLLGVATGVITPHHAF